MLSRIIRAWLLVIVVCAGLLPVSAQGDTPDCEILRMGLARLHEAQENTALADMAMEAVEIDTLDVIYNQINMMILKRAESLLKRTLAVYCPEFNSEETSQADDEPESSPPQAEATTAVEAATETPSAAATAGPVEYSFTIPFELQFADSSCPEPLIVPSTMTLTIGPSGTAAALTGSGSGFLDTYCGQSARLTWSLAYSASLTVPLPDGAELGSQVNFEGSSTGSIDASFQLGDCSGMSFCFSSTVPMVVTLQGVVDLTTRTGSGTVGIDIENLTAAEARWQLP